MSRPPIGRFVSRSCTLALYDFIYNDWQPVCIARMGYGTAAKEHSPPPLEVILLECRPAESGADEPDFEVLGLEFFDDETMIVLYRVRGAGDGKLMMCT